MKRHENPWAWSLIGALLVAGLTGCSGTPKTGGDRAPSSSKKSIFHKGVDGKMVESEGEGDPQIFTPGFVLGVQKPGAKGTRVVFPSGSGANAKPQQGCGNLFYTETGRDAANDEDAFYVFKVDCAREGLTKPADYFVRFTDAEIKKGQRPHIKYWRRLAAAKGGRQASPYICFQAMLDKPLCEGSSYYQTISTPVCHFTSKPEYMKRWGATCAN